MVLSRFIDGCATLKTGRVLWLYKSICSYFYLISKVSIMSVYDFNWVWDLNDEWFQSLYRTYFALSKQMDRFCMSNDWLDNDNIMPMYPLESWFHGVLWSLSSMRWNSQNHARLTQSSIGSIYLSIEEYTFLSWWVFDKSSHGTCLRADESFWVRDNLVVMILDMLDHI